MRKFFQRLDTSSKVKESSEYQRDPLGALSNSSSSSGSSITAINPTSSATHSGGSFIGKVFSLGQYHCTVEDIIAEGGFALVFLVKAQGNLGRFALKRLFVNSEHDLENAKNEIDIATKLGSHKNIVNLVESRVNYCGNGVYEIFLLMDYCKGQLLQKMNDKLKDNSRFTEPEIVGIFCDLCEAVGKMHLLEPPIIHRDLKVENILISERGNYQLCDFGSATSKVLCSLDPGQSALSIEEEIKRYTTLAYRAPEMIDVYSGQPISTKSDIWAMGVCLYKLCFFTMPFGESMLAIQNAALTIPDDKVDQYSSKLLSLIGLMLTADVDLRPDIFQVSQLAFKLAGNVCPVINVKAKVLVPDWNELKVPPTESQAREIRKSVSSQNLQSQHQQDRTTSVNPRQRPKASISLSATLPTSPVAFPPPVNRATTPCDLTSTVNSLTSTVVIPPPPPSVPVVLPGPTPSSATTKKTDDVEPLKNGSNDDTLNFGDSLNSTNPFLESHAVSAFHIPSPSRSPSQSLRNLSMPLDSSSPTAVDGRSQNSGGGSAHHHRRNQSDTSAFNQRNVMFHEGDNKMIVSNSYSLQSSVNSSTNSGNRSLNPFIDSNAVSSFEDQQFGHEFDRIRLENKLCDNSESIIFSNNYDPFEASTRASTTTTTAVNNPHPHQLEHLPQQPRSITDGLNGSNSTERLNPANIVEIQRPSAISTRPKQNTIITITSGSNFVVQSNDSTTSDAHKVIKPSPSSAFVAVGTNFGQNNVVVMPTITAPTIVDQFKHLTLAAPTDQSISSSSQGPETFNQAANYMPLYSSEESEKSSSDADSDSDESVDVAAPIADSVLLGDDLLDNLIHDSSNDLTMPLVDVNDDDDYEEDDEDEDDDDDSSIGSASDLQHSSSESNLSSDSEEEYDSDDLSSKSSSERSVNSLSDQAKTAEELSGFVVVHHHVPSTHHRNLHHHHQISTTSSMNLTRPVQDTSQLTSTGNNHHEITGVTDGDGTSVSEILSTTSSMNLSAKVAQDNSNVTIDQLIGHIDAHRPLLEEDDDAEDDPISPNQTQEVKPFIEMDKEIEYIPPQPQSSTTSATLVSTDPAPIDMFASMTSSTHSVILASNSMGHTDFDVVSSTDSEENRRLDEEVEMSLTRQVLLDQMNRKDLFGSIPFTDKELINKTMLEQQTKASLQKTLSLERAPPPQPSALVGSNKTDLFGAVPFNSTEKIDKIEQQTQQQLPSGLGAITTVPIKLDPPPAPSSVIAQSALKHCPPLDSISGRSKPTTIGANTVATGITLANISSKPVSSVVCQQQQQSQPVTSVAVTSVVVGSAPTAISQVEPVSKSPVPSSKSIKIKTKVAKKYEVDESDDEVDGLLDPDEDTELALNDKKSLKKKVKKDGKKEKSDKKLKVKQKEDKKSKEKEDKKEKKNREKLEKVKEKELRTKTKEEKEKSKKAVKVLSGTGSGSGETKEKKKLRVLSKVRVKEFNIKASRGEGDVEKDSGGCSPNIAITSGLITSTPIKTVMEKSSLKKLSKKQHSQQTQSGFANMSFEDEAVITGTSTIPQTAQFVVVTTANTALASGVFTAVASIAASSIASIAVTNTAAAATTAATSASNVVSTVTASGMKIVELPSTTTIAKQSTLSATTTTANVTITRC